MLRLLYSLVTEGMEGQWILSGYPGEVFSCSYFVMKASGTLHQKSYSLFIAWHQIRIRIKKCVHIDPGPYFIPKMFTTVMPFEFLGLKAKKPRDILLYTQVNVTWMVQPQLNLGIFDKLLEENQSHLSAVNLLLSACWLISRGCCLTC